MHFNVILEPGGWLSCQTLLLTILILTKLKIQQLTFQTTGSMTRMAHEGVTCKPLLLPPAPIPPSFCIKKEKKNNGDQNIRPIIACCQKALAVSHSPHLREIKIGIKCKAMTRSPLIHIRQNNYIIPIVFNWVNWVDLVQVLYLPLKTEKKKLNLCGKSHTTSTISTSKWK